MKCPKCGYTSFESYDACKKCSADLTEFKQTHGLSAVVLPPSVRAAMAAELASSQGGAEAADEGGSDMFSFELPTEQGGAPAAAPAADPFAFGESPAVEKPVFTFDTPGGPASEDPFAALLESAPASPAAPAAPQSSGFELNSFSWDDTPEPAQPGAPAEGAGKPEDDDFNSLFGDLGGDKK